MPPTLSLFLSLCLVAPPNPTLSLTHTHMRCQPEYACSGLITELAIYIKQLSVWETERKEIKSRPRQETDRPHAKETKGAAHPKCNMCEIQPSAGRYSPGDRDGGKAAVCLINVEDGRRPSGGRLCCCNGPVYTSKTWCHMGTLHQHDVRCGRCRGVGCLHVLPSWTD